MLVGCFLAYIESILVDIKWHPVLVFMTMTRDPSLDYSRGIIIYYEYNNNIYCGFSCDLKRLFDNTLSRLRKPSCISITNEQNT
ncbi:hypothetical protein GCM10027170_15220 [Aliiglaciecola aliphaticivorans]